VENVAKRGPLATVQGSLANTRKKKTCEMMVYSDVDS